MSIYSMYLDRQKNPLWVTKFQSTSNNQCGKTFSYINTNFRSISAFFNQLVMFEPKDGLRRRDWNDYQDNGQEKDKHRIINLMNAGFLIQQGDIYRITSKGKLVLSLYRDKNLSDADKWALLLLLLLDYTYDGKELDIIYSSMSLYKDLEDAGISAIELLKFLKAGLHVSSREDLFSLDIFWLVSFAKDKEFVKCFFNSTNSEKQELYDYVKMCSRNKNSTDCIAHKFVSGGAYSVPTFVDDLRVIISLLILLMLQDVNSINYLRLYAKLFHIIKDDNLIGFYNNNRTIFDSTYNKTINKINNKIGVNSMEIDKRLEDVKVALGFSKPTENSVESEITSAWFVGATGNDSAGVYTDFSDQYIAENRWENLYNDKYIDLVKKMKEGDHIVIKAAYTKKKDLPFDNHGRVIGVMSIKAIGVITKNHGDGKNIDVKWEKVSPIKEWYGDGVLRTTVHFVDGTESYIKKALLQFVFYNVPQDYSIYEESEDSEVAVVEDDKGCVLDSNILPVFGKRTGYYFPFNTILYGAPGTGKTYSTVEYALSICKKLNVDLKQKTVSERATAMKEYHDLMNQGRIVFTTFHQSYGYEDFIQGLRPNTENGTLTFVPVDGVFKNICAKALASPDDNFVIIIDEINRANISKVFGELITLIESDKRWGELNSLSVTLPSGDVFAVPNNLYIIGTMNSADKSISLIDAALRRRFDFIEVVPNLDLIEDSVLKTVLERLNKGLISELESTDLLIGHAYFIGKSADDLCDIMNHSIIPLLYEYFYDNSKKVGDQIKRAIEGYDFEITASTMGRIKLVKKS